MNHSEARDQIYSAMSSSWREAGYVAIFAETYSKDQVPQDETPWAYFSIEHGDVIGAMGFGRKLYTRTGVCTASIFVPMSSPTGNPLPDRYETARIVANSLEGVSTVGGAWFRNVQINEEGSDGRYIETTITAQFEYYEIKEA